MRLSIGLLSVGMVGAMLPGVVAAYEVEAQPGRYEMERIGINTVDGASHVPGACNGFYLDPFDGNSVVSNANSREGTRIHAVVNRSGAVVTCQFTDTSGRYETDAEIGFSDDCSYAALDGLWSSGVGHVTAAANNDDLTGGNVTIVCRFKASDFTAD